MKWPFPKQPQTDLVSETLAHDAFFEKLRASEYDRLDKLSHCYLDYTGGNLYAKSQLNTHFERLENNTYGNPHSSNPTSVLSSGLVKAARHRVLEFFNAEDYFCIFTSNASGALKIVGECYPFGSNSHLLLLADNHNSVNGIREYCRRAGGQHDLAPIKVEDLSIPAEKLEKQLSGSNAENKLFAFPAQSNVSGRKHSLSWIDKAQKQGWDVLLDAAAYVPTNVLDLKAHQPNFVSVSFYKIFGYPTGVGCLLVRKDSYSKLEKKWFAGGTVSLASAITPYHYLVNDHERFENGTINYLGIPAITDGLDYIESIGMQRINERVSDLANYLYQRLIVLKHGNGQHQLEIFGDPLRKETGGTMIMCFFNPDGQKIPFEFIESLANKRGISLRSGCFCNPGLDEINNCLTTDELSGYFSTHESGDYKDMINFLKKMRGATRVSVGIPTVKRDLDQFIQFVSELSDQQV